MKETLRAVVGARVSVVKGAEKVSHEAQHEAGVKYAQRQGYDIVGAFQDLDVSAKVSPWKREDLGPWLSDDALDQWDVMIFAKIDRAFRSIRDCVKVAEWMQEHRKILVFADDGLVLNYRDPNAKKDMSEIMAELFVYLGAFFAQIELNRFQTRSLDAHSVLKHQDRWAGGIAPDGFKTVPHPSGKGRGLATDPERKAMLHKMAQLLMEEDSNFSTIARWLDENHYPTNRDYQRKPQDRKGTEWSVTEVINVLTDHATQGIKMSGKGKSARPVLDEEGRKIQMAPPTFDPDYWERIQLRVDDRRIKRTRVNENPLLKVAYCGSCGNIATLNVHRKGEKTYSYFRCSKLKPCPHHRIPTGVLLQSVEDFFLAELGDQSVTVREYVKGDDFSEELAQVNQTIDSLREDREMGLYSSSEDEERYRTQMKSLIARRNELEAKPRTQSGWVHRNTSETYSEAWEKAGLQERRKLLIDAGISVEIYPNHVTNVILPEDMKKEIESAQES